MIDRCVADGRLAVVGELYGEVQVGRLDQCLNLLKVVPALAADPQLVALDLGAYVPWTLIADELGDLLRILLADAFLRAGRDLVELAG